jgi:hypothetical protein
MMQHSILFTLVLAMAASTFAAPAPFPLAQYDSAASTIAVDPFSTLSISNPGNEPVPTATYYPAAATSTFVDPWATKTAVYDPDALPPREGLGHGW